MARPTNFWATSKISKRPSGSQHEFSPAHFGATQLRVSHGQIASLAAITGAR